MSKREVSTAFRANPAPARHSQRVLGPRVEPINCSTSIGAEGGGIHEYATDARGAEAQGRRQGWVDMEE